MKLLSPQLHLRLLMLLMAMLCSLLATQAYWRQVTNYDELQRLRNVEQRVAYLRASDTAEMIRQVAPRGKTNVDSKEVHRTV